jgi:hypothetical protein
MRNLIRALAKLSGRKLQQLIRAGRIDSKVRALETRLAAVRKEEARLERRLASAGVKLEALLGGAGAKRRGPAAARRGGRRRANAQPLSQVLKEILAKKGEAMTVADLAAGARASGYKTKSKPPVFAITVSLALRKNPALFARVGRKYQLAKGAEAQG